MKILKKTIDKNNSICKFEYQDIDIINTIVMKILIEDYFSININIYGSRTIEEILRICGFKEEYFGIYFDIEQKDDKEYVSRIERIITKKIPKIKKDLIEK